MIVDCEKCEKLNSCEIFWTNKESLWLCDECQKEHYPNAMVWDKLISAAPDLLEACEQLLSFAEYCDEDFRNSTPSPDAEILELARKAIVKAKGEKS